MKSSIIVYLTTFLPLSQCYFTAPPLVSPATQLPNKIFSWRGQNIRYQVAGPEDSSKTVVLVHGLFVNSDHWRFTLKGLADAGYRAYAIDLLGSGYSSKPPRDSEEARMLNGENGRFLENDGVPPTDYSAAIKRSLKTNPTLPVLNDVKLGTASGGDRIADVDLRHPLNSCYNFFTWSEQISDFTSEVIGKKSTIVANSIGTISSLQATIDNPSLFDGVFVVNPNFRELHSAEIPFSKAAMPVLRSVQQLLREKGQGLFDTLATPETVKQILKEPYAVTDAIDDTLVEVLLDPLLTPGASDVVFDTLSYSAGPLPEQQLQMFGSENCPVWICYGDKDPWTPAKRVERLQNIDSVKRVIRLNGVGHCPHDEAPELVNPLILEFLSEVKSNEVEPKSNSWQVGLKNLLNIN